MSQTLCPAPPEYVDAALNDAQQQAVSSDAPILLTLAGPGAGKTKVLIERIKRLIADGTDPARIAAISFTNAAANELRQRLDGHGEIGFTGTLHSFLLRLITENALALGFASARLSVLSEEQDAELRERCAAEVKHKGSKKELVAAIEQVLRCQVQRNGFNPTSLAATRYVNFLRANSLLSFDTILLEGLRLLNSPGRGPAILPFDQILVDEYQDVSDLDAEIYRAMRAPNFFAVGDPDQNIFQWRGANVGNIVGLADSIADSKRGELVRLESNYRCGQAICDAANRLIRHNLNRVDKETVSATGLEGLVEMDEYPSARHEMNAVAERLFNSNWPSAAVLLRTNLLVDQWVEYLVGGGCPVARRAPTDRPADWPLARAALALLVDSANDWLAYQYLRIKEGASVAEHAQLAAKAAGKPISAFGGLSDHANVSISCYAPTLARIGLSQESINLIETAVSDMPAKASGADLLLALAQTEESSHEEGEGVTVCTYHAAKGREFDCVFLPCAEQEIIPGTAKSMDIESERRLFYVGLTRARHHVTISYARERKPAYGAWKPVPVMPSQFITEALNS